MPDHIDAETVDTASQPESHDVVNRLTNPRIAPVEVGLLGKERMIVILPGVDIVLPCAAAELGHPVVGRTAVFCRLAPEVPVAFRVVPRVATLQEPGMLI